MTLCILSFYLLLGVDLISTTLPKFLVTLKEEIAPPSIIRSRPSIVEQLEQLIDCCIITCHKGSYFIKLAKDITFKCVLGANRQNNTEMAKTLERVLDGAYKVCDSSITSVINN